MYVLLPTILMQNPDSADAVNMGGLIDNFILRILRALETEVSSATELFVQDAQVLCGILMLFYFVLKAYQLMTGDAKIDLIPLLRPFLFFMIVTGWGAFITVMNAPLRIVESRAANTFTDTRQETNDLFRLREQRKNELILKVFERTEVLNNQDSEGIFSTNIFQIDDNVREAIRNAIARSTLMLQARIQTLISKLWEAIITAIFKACIYLLFYIRIFILALLRIIGPFVFALSIIPAYRDLFLQWISKYIAVMLYGAFAYIAVILAFLQVKFALRLDILYYNRQIALADSGDLNEVAQFYELLLRPDISRSFLTVSMIVGIIGLLLVPIISTWILGSNSTTLVANKAVNLAATPVRAAATLVTKK